jgi:hypothetical protein
MARETRPSTFAAVRGVSPFAGVAGEALVVVRDERSVGLGMVASAASELIELRKWPLA